MNHSCHPSKLLTFLFSGILLFAALWCASAQPPYPKSPVIVDVKWAPVSQIIRMAKGSDNWPMTWADDGNLYTAYGDGNGFKPFTEEKLSLGLACVFGFPPDIRAENIRSKSGETIGDGKKGGKASGLLMVDGLLYMWIRNANNSQLSWSQDHGRTWEKCDWKFTESFGCPTFLNFGRDYQGARDDYVYIYSQDSGSAYDAADGMVMARVPKDQLTRRDSYEFFEKLSPQNAPRWTKNIDQRGAVFEFKNNCYRSGISYNPGLKRYLWRQTLPGDAPRFKGGFAIYDAPEPWGPWTTAYFVDQWDVGPGETGVFPVKWISDDGRFAYLVFSGDDYFSVRKAEFILSSDN